MKRYIRLSIIFLGLLSCTAKDSTQFVLLENFSFPRESDPILSELFTGNHKITALETTKFSLLGPIDKIKKFMGDYYICSSNGRSIHRFNNEGKFISSLEKQGQGPEEYHRIEDFDICEDNGSVEVWISDNRNLKVYDTTDFTYKYQISFPFIIHKFKRIDSSRILLVTGLNDYILTLTDMNGKVISEYLEKEIPFLMFRPVQFTACQSYSIFQLGISNSFVAFDSQTNTFKKGYFANKKELLTEKQLLDFF